MNTIYQYKGNPITFLSSDSVMINATQMAQSFGKRPIDWLKSQQTNEFLDTLSKVRKITLADLVVVRKGGNNAGTWMHEDVALEFARWLSPAFAIWCNDRIKELLTQGVATVANDDMAILHAMRVLEKRVAASKKRVLALEAENKAQEIEISSLRKGNEYLNTILNSKGTVTVSQIAQDYGFSARNFNKKLNEMRIHHKVNGQWVLYAPYLGKGYVQSKTIVFTHSDGRPDTRMNTEWTQKGRLFLYDALKESGIYPLIEVQAAR